MSSLIGAYSLLDAVGNNNNIGDYLYGVEVFARKVFIGGLPIDVTEEQINIVFGQFGALLIDWPRRAGSGEPQRSQCYVFLVYEFEHSVQKLVSACYRENNHYYLFVSSPTMKHKPVQVRPWKLVDADYIPNPNVSLNTRKMVFIGGVPRPLPAYDLAKYLHQVFGEVIYAGVDTDPELKYPKGAARVAFANHSSVIDALKARFVVIKTADVDKRVEVKPYVMEDQMCDECNGTKCNYKFAPYFCGSIDCLQYYCETCWNLIHFGASRRTRTHHRPMVKLSEQDDQLLKQFDRGSASISEPRSSINSQQLPFQFAWP